MESGFGTGSALGQPVENAWNEPTLRFPGLPGFRPAARQLRNGMVVGWRLLSKANPGATRNFKDRTTGQSMIPPSMPFIDPGLTCPSGAFISTGRQTIVGTARNIQSCKASSIRAIASRWKRTTAPRFRPRSRPPMQWRSSKAPTSTDPVRPRRLDCLDSGLPSHGRLRNYPRQ